MTAPASHDSIKGLIRQRLRRLEETPSPPYGAPRRLFYLIEVTGRCSLGCPVCYACATPHSGEHQPPERILALGRRVRADGGRFVQLIGGEPAEHPELPAIVRGLRRLRLSPVLVTNGIRLGEDPAFAPALKHAGLHKAAIQFDTLDSSTSATLRGRDLVAVKRRAIANAASAGLRTGLIVTTCDLNLREAGDILRLALDHSPALNTLTFQTLTPVGRRPAAIRPVDRESILSELLRSAGSAGIGLAPGDIMPPPQYVPWRALTHPACSVLLHVCRDTAIPSAWPLGRDVDLERFQSLLASSRSRGDGLAAKIWIPLKLLWQCTRPGRRLATLQHVAGLVTGKGKQGLCVIHVDTAAHGGECTEDRLRRCPATFVTGTGFEGVCARLCGASGEAPA